MDGEGGDVTIDLYGTPGRDGSSERGWRIGLERPFLRKEGMSFS